MDLPSSQSQSQEPNEWSLDNDEIASITSEDLYASRPNRWTGPRQSWRTLTAEERLMWQAMQRLENQDLSLHLYNSFALRRRAKDPKMAYDVTIKLEDGTDAIWAPSKAWTAWPLVQNHLPQEGLFMKEDDEDEEFTYRKQETRLPSSDLQEELSSTVLRFAKERFQKRNRQAAEALVLPSVEEEAVVVNTGLDPDLGSKQTSIEPEPESTTESVPDEGETETEAERDTKQESDGSQETKTKPAAASRATSDYDPVFCADDDLSYDLLSAPVRHILSQLDKTLQILHTSREAGVNYQSDSSDSESSSVPETPRRPRGRPQTAPDASHIPLELRQTPPRATKRGRPRKIRLPLEGESQEDFLARIAREGHRRLPPKPPRREINNNNNNDNDNNNKNDNNKDDEFEAWLKKDSTWNKPQSGNIDDDESDGSSSSSSSRSSSISSSQIKNESTKRHRLTRLGLRDWSDILGAASLAGFPPSVISRTATRCASLFGQSMTIRTLHEVPSSHGNGVQTSHYHPEPIAAFSPSLSPSPPPPQQQRHRTPHYRGRRSRGVSSTSRSPSRSPSHSRSRSVSVGRHVCPVGGCERSVRGFARKPNLTRHMRLVHQGYTHSNNNNSSSRAVSINDDGGGSVSDGEVKVDVDMDSEDEVLGAVHVDGFLKPIIPPRGWRGEDVKVRKRKRKRPQRGNGGDGYSDDDEDEDEIWESSKS